MGRLQYFASWVWFVGILLLAAGCQSHSSVVSERASVEAQAPPPRVSEKLLQQYGLETLWYNEPRDRKVDGGVHLAELEGDSLFVATAPRAGNFGGIMGIVKTPCFIASKYRTVELYQSRSTKVSTTNGTKKTVSFNLHCN